MRIIDREIVAAMIISKDNKIFLGKKHADRGGVYIDCWHIPGGGVEKDETLETAVQREVLEETGIDIGNYSAEMIDDQGHGESEKIDKHTGEKVLCKMHFIVFKISIDDQDADEIEVKMDDDLEEYQWAELNDLANIQLTPPSITLFNRLGILKNE
jgi:8-oxo-dGTP pyrophosphatase MutT (NUDIX family)